MILSTKIQKDLRKVLRETADGLSISELAELTGYLNTSIRRVLTCNMPDVYIVNWREMYRCRPTALYKAVTIPENAPEPPRKAITPYVKKEREAPEISIERKGKSVPSGLTTIRGPWPKWND